MDHQVDQDENGDPERGEILVLVPIIDQETESRSLGPKYTDPGWNSLMISWCWTSSEDQAAGLPSQYWMPMLKAIDLSRNLVEYLVKLPDTGMIVAISARLYMRIDTAIVIMMYPRIRARGPPVCSERPLPMKRPVPTLEPMATISDSRRYRHEDSQGSGSAYLDMTSF